MTRLTRDALEALGFARLGTDVRISDSCRIYGAEHIRLGDHVRIDDMAVITAAEEVKIGSHVHIGAHVFVTGQAGLELGDFCGLSPGVAVFTATDDFSGGSLTGPTVPDDYRSVVRGHVRLGRHVVVGARSVVLPDVRIDDGVTIGALSLVNRSLDGWGIYAGVPVRLIRPRDKRVLDLERQLAERG